MKFSLNTDIIRNSTLSNYSIAAYIALKQLAQMSSITLCDTLHITASTIPDTLCQKLEHTVSQREKEGLQNGLQQLIDLKLITPLQTIIHSRKCIYIFDTQSLLNDTDCFSDISNDQIPKYFTSICTSEIHSIFAINNIDNYALLRLFVVMASTLTVQKNRSYKNSKKSVLPNAIGTMTQQTLSVIANTNVKTVRKYIDVLEENNILYIYRHKTNVYKQSTFSLSNCYGRFADKQCVIDCAQEREEKTNKSNSKKQHSQTQANNNRRLKQIYNNLLKGKTYSNEDIVSSFLYMQAKNSTLKTPFSLDIYNNFDCIREIFTKNGEVISK